MQSAYGGGGGGGGGGVSEMQQFLAAEGCPSSSLFSISTSVTTLHHPNHHHHHHHMQPHHLQQHDHRQAAPPPPPSHFPHFHSMPPPPPPPITQQLLHQTHYFQLFSHSLDRESAPEASNSPTMGGGGGGSGGGAPSFMTAAMGFKLGVNESSGDGLNDDDGSESHVHAWQREEESAIKEPFWRPLDLDYINRNNKRCKDKQLESSTTKYCKKSSSAKDASSEQHQEQGTNNSGSNYKLFSELEAIYKPGGSGDGGGGSANNQTGSSSALTGENPLMSLVAPEPPEETAGLGSDTSTGEEVPPVKKHVKGGSGSSSRRKRRRRWRQQQLSSIAAFFENLVKQLMDHQEGLHRRFLEAMERRDEERASREEAWRRHEAAKSSQEAAERAQERALASAREAAIISFLEKITGETLNLPPPPTKSPQEGCEKRESGSDAILLDHHAETMSNNSNNNMIAMAGNQSRLNNTSRWPKAEVQALIGVRSGLEGRFQEPGLKGPLWEEVSVMMSAMGYSRSAKRCKEKWENINKYFRKTKESGKKRPVHSKTCPYFHQLDQLYSKPLNHLPPPPPPPPPLPNSVADHRKDNSELLDAIIVPSSDHQQRVCYKFSDMTSMWNDNDGDDVHAEENDSGEGEDRGGPGDEEGEGEGQEHVDDGHHQRRQELQHDPAIFFHSLES